jgi:uncharacterized repeat protein (TIGR03803 family)
MTTFGFGVFLHIPRGQGRRVVTAWLALAASCLLSSTATAGPAIPYNFTKPVASQVTAATNRDGSAPAAKLSLVGGALYGTTPHGGANGAGSIFRLTPGGAFSNLYSFSAATNSLGEVVYNIQPNELALGNDGNFYGTTQAGGTNFTGTIFVISPTGAFTNLYNFGPFTNTSSGLATVLDGETPVGALVQVSDGSFYGVTRYGGSNGTGTIFRFNPTANTFTNVYSFSAVPPGTITTNGTVPNPLYLAANGTNFYGTTRGGGFADAGTFFRFNWPSHQFTQVQSFDGRTASNNPVIPNSTLVQGSDGNLYGTSEAGGSQGGGGIYQVATNGNITLIYSFPELDRGAVASLSGGVSADLFGTIGANGLNGNGVVFRVKTTGEFGAYHFSPLDPNSDNTDGANPSAALTADALGNLYGSCAAGGTNGSGVIFQINASTFGPPYLTPQAIPSPHLTNTLVGAPVSLTNGGGGIPDVSIQWLHDGTNLAVGGDITNATSDTLTITNVRPRDTGSYALRLSNVWGAVTSAVTVVTVTPPAVFITSPLPFASTGSPVFSGTATNAPLFSNGLASDVVLTNVLYSISNALYGSNITGGSTITSGANGLSNWSFNADPFPGTNILTVQSVDVSGNISLPVSRTFFYAVPTRLTVVTTGSGAAAFNFTNGSLLNVGESYSITATPNSSIFSNWSIAGLVSYLPTASFTMTSNLVATAYLLARQTPVVSITSPSVNARTNAPVFTGTATPSPLLPGVNPAHLMITNVVYWLTNVLTGQVQTGSAAIRGGSSVSNWTIIVTPLGGTNILAVQGVDISGAYSPIASRTFFYKVPAAFSLLTAGNGNGSFTSTASVTGDALPTNGALLNVGEGYSVTAVPNPASSFSNWVSSIPDTITNVTRSFVMQAGFSLTATFNAIPPTIAITSPTANQRTAAPALNGTATGHYRITNVSYSIVSAASGSRVSGSARLVSGGGTVSNWSIAVVPPPGTNTLTVQCQDISGSGSPSVSQTFFYKVPAALAIHLAGTGNGTVQGTASVAGDTAPANGALLNLGESYTVTATPDSHSLFSNWFSLAGAVASPRLSFVMQSNLVLTATFASNFYPHFAGAYNGLFYPTNGVTVETSGMLNNLVLLPSGAFTATLLYAGHHYAASSNFDASGESVFSTGPLALDLILNQTNGEINGTVNTSQGAANLIADLASNVLPSAEYTLLLSPTTNATAVSPPGDGYLLVTNHQGGVATFSGALADGAGYSQSVPVSQSGYVPLYAGLYTNTGNPGLLLGWINLTNLNTSASGNALAWIKKPFHAPALYTNGFTNVLAVQGALWTNQPALALTNGQLLLSNSSLVLAYTDIVVSNNVLTNRGASPTNYLTGSVNSRTGLLQLTFVSGAHTNGATGAILQDTTNGGGFFLTTTNAGSVLLHP